MCNHRSKIAIAALLLSLASPIATAETGRSSSPSQFWKEENNRFSSEGAAPAPAHNIAPAAPAAVFIGHRDSGRRRRAFASAPPASAPSSTVVAVFGDRLGRALAMGLDDGGAGPVSVVDATNDDAGLASKDFDVWLQTIRDRLAKPDRISIAVMLIGANDRTALDGLSEASAPGTPNPQSLYEAHIDAVAAAFHASHVPLIWVGLPAVRNDVTSAAFVRLNGLFRDRAAQDGASYVDSWEAFLDDSGRYSPVGPNVEGDNVKLRLADGFGFTRAGARKLASFVEPDIKRLRPPPVMTGSEIARISLAMPAEFDSALDIDVNAQIRREAGLPSEPASPAPPAAQVKAAPLKPAAGPVLPLTAPPLSPGGTLASVDAPAGSDAEKLRVSLVAAPASEPSPKRPGRADDFSWPKN